MTANEVQTLKQRLRSGASPGELARESGHSYMSIYKLAVGATWKKVGGNGRIIQRREVRATPEARNWAVSTKAKGKSNRYIAAKLGLSETTVCRMLADGELLKAFRAQKFLMTCGNNVKTAKEFNITPKELERLLARAASEVLPPRLRKELDT